LTFHPLQLPPSPLEQVVLLEQVVVILEMLAGHRPSPLFAVLREAVIPVVEMEALAALALADQSISQALAVVLVT
jgi:hypothetical protein